MQGSKATLVLLTAINSFISLTSAQSISFSSPLITLHVSPPINDKSFITLHLQKEKAANIPPNLYISEAWTVSEMFQAGANLVIDEAEIVGGPSDADSILCKFYSSRGGGSGSGSSEETTEASFTIGEVVSAADATGLYCHALYFDFPPGLDAVQEVAGEERY